jgi:hypothetical protein
MMPTAPPRLGAIGTALECRLVCEKAVLKRNNNAQAYKSGKRLVMLVMLPTEVVGATISLIAIWALFITDVVIIFKT